MYVTILPMRSDQRGTFALAGLLVAGLLLAACGGEASPAVADDGLLVLPTASGGQLVFNDLVGSPALLWFWAPW